MVKVSLSGNTIYLQCDAIRPKLNCFISMIISVVKLSGFPLLISFTYGVVATPEI